VDNIGSGEIEHLQRDQLDKGIEKNVLPVVIGGGMTFDCSERLRDAAMD
jgi:hypothetical protein